MRTVETKLADWHRLYKELAQAQSRLAQGGDWCDAGMGRDELEAEVARLQRDCDAALNVVHTLIHNRRPSRAGESSRPRA